MKLIAVILFGSLLPAPAHTWHFHDGGQFGAEFIRRDSEERIVVGKTKGETAAVLISRLSNADREWIAKHGGAAPPSFTSLTRALRLEQFDEAKRHITRELVNQPDAAGYHPISYAIYTGNTEIIRALLDAEAEPNGMSLLGMPICDIPLIWRPASMSLPSVTRIREHGNRCRLQPDRRRRKPHLL